MSQVTEEQLSAFLDGELPPGQLDLLLARIDRDPAYRQRLARYALIGECLRGADAPVATLDLAERVRSALMTESGPAAAPRRAPAWRGWVAGGLATAATVLLAVLVTAPGTMNPPTERLPTAIAATAADDESLAPVTVPAARHRLTPRAAARLNGYLAAHGNFASELSRSTLDSHLVVARADRASWSQVQDPADAR